MANSIKLDCRNQEIFYVPATDVEFMIEDRTDKIKLTNIGKALEKKQLVS